MGPLTRSCFLVLLLGSLSLLAPPLLLRTCLLSLWIPFFRFHALALISLSLAKVRLLLTLTLLDLTVWCSGQTALFRFLLAKTALMNLPTALFVSLGPHFSLRQALYAQVFPLKSALFCKFFTGLGSTNKSATSLLFSSSLTLVLFSQPCPLLRLSFYLNLSGRSGRNYFLSPPVLSGYNGSPDTRFSRETTRLMSWPDGERYSCLLQYLVVSLLLSLVFSWIEGVLFYLNSSIHRFPRFPLQKLCFLVMLAGCSLVFAASDTAYC